MNEINKESATMETNSKTNNESDAPQNQYWLSIDQWRKDPQFKELAEREFVTSPFAPEEADGGWARREFLKLMGASLALTSFGCTRQAQKIIPYVKRPEEIVPGIANYYSSSFVDVNEGFGLIVRTREGRPIKAEGNPDHPLNMGGMSARAHAHVLSLYDPDRATGALKNLLNEEKTNRDTISIAWDKLDEEVAAELKKGGVALLTSTINSPSERQAIADFQRSFSAQHYIWDEAGLEEIREGQAASYGREVLPAYQIDKADYIVSLGADFLGTFLAPTEMTKLFSSRRKPDADAGMNKLVVFEGMLSLTGANADERYQVRSSQLPHVAYALLNALNKKRGIALSTQARKAITETSYEGIDLEKVNAVADELWAKRGKGLVLAGGLEGRSENSAALQIAVNALNSALGNDGKTVKYKDSDFRSFRGRTKNLVKLTKDLEAGRVKTLIVYGVNPVYSAPAGLKVAEALKKANVIYCGDRNDETGKVSAYIATTSHPMEAWGDMEIRKGVYSIQQPTIRPLNDTRAFGASLLSWAQTAGRAGSRLDSGTWYDYVRKQWKSLQASNRASAGGSFENFWSGVLETGVFDTSTSARKRTYSSRTAQSSALRKLSAPAKGYELTMYQTVGLRDGALANVSWLQEFPDPVTKICWDNYLCMSPADATREDLKEGQVVEIEVGGTKRQFPVHVQPGQAPGVLAVAVGYGRTAAGKVANNVGQPVFDLVAVNGDDFVYSGLPTQLKKTKKMYELANVQGHHSMEGRQIVVEATLDQYKEKASANIHKHKVFSIWDDHEYKGFKWGMSVDLSSCTGCGSCVVACQSENNIPVVGKKYVLQGREMSWIRIDRYYVGNPDNPDSVHQPILCMHCDNAPCETVCPVAATVHSDEGTNDMIYNRCVGTRYCANNCPYKVRRFNWFNYTKIESPLHMALNPDVTVRSRGVMEKCTFCNHRIKDKKREAMVAKREFKATDVITACQQSCPADAINFGDMNDADSTLTADFKDGRTYSLLEELANKPAVRFKTKIRNTASLKGGKHGHDSKGGH